MLLTVMTSLLYVLAINAAVRSFGNGYPGVLAVGHLKQKTQALGLWVRHMAVHPFSREHPDPLPILKAAAKRHRVPSDLVIAIARAESALKPHRISAAGAMGLMQLMPGTAADLKVKDPFDTEENIDGGVRYVRFLWKRYRGDRRRIAAAYNFGPGHVPRRGALRLPGETRHYVNKVVGKKRATR